MATQTVGGKVIHLGTGRRKTAVARVRVQAGTGKLTVNGRPLNEYFLIDNDRRDALAPLVATGKQESVDVSIQCTGGGIAGQADAVMMGLSRALKSFDGETEPVLRQHSLLTRDSRMKERKHYGLRGARRGTQFSKR
jgi:small subunit ribosomal protein S9